ncbi:MAG: hypothetical protein EOO45_24940 [Flavobacterium sp.]|nr:MAG: hypothetical protein EOO45_24940 [Flavobacterium sp.]
MEELSGRSWDYTLYRNGADLILSVVCGTVGIYEVNVKLDKEETRRYEGEGEDYIATFAKSVRNDPNEYTSRHINDI